MAAIEHDSALGVGQATVVTLTVAEGVDLDAVGRAFAERYAGLFTGAWLVPETAPTGLRHYHGLVIGNRAEIIGAWQLCYGGIKRAQWLDPLDQGDHEHLFRAVAYAMKRRHVEPGEVIATGVLGSPWHAAQRDPEDASPYQPLSTDVAHLDLDEDDPDEPAFTDVDLDPDEPLSTDVAHLDPEGDDFVWSGLDHGHDGPRTTDVSHHAPKHSDPHSTDGGGQP